MLKSKSYYSSYIQIDPHPEVEMLSHVSTEGVILDANIDALWVQLTQDEVSSRDREWVPPTDFIRKEDSVKRTPHPILLRLTAIKKILINALVALGKIDRMDHRRIIHKAYYTLIKPQNFIIMIGAGARNIKCFDINYTPSLIFDDNEILKCAIENNEKIYPKYSFSK